MEQLLSAVGVTPTSSSAIPGGFSAKQWKRLQAIAKTNPQVADLLKKLTTTTTPTTPNPDDAWRRVMPTDTSQLLKQLSYNAGEMGMPGGYVGAIQLPAYGSTQPPVNNPDMSKYGQAPSIGEATFYQQSMKGGMAPIAAMSPLGVPEGWNPGGSSGTSVEDQLKDYLAKLGKGGRSRGTPQDIFQQSLENFVKTHPNGSTGVFAGFAAADASDRRRALAKRATNNNSGGGTGGTGSGGTGTGTGNNPGLGIPISLPYGY